MSILSKIKKGVKQSGTNKGKVLYLKPDSKVRVRFLQDVEDAVIAKKHDSFEKGIDVLCQKHVGKKCKYCKDDSLRTREHYVWSVWDHDAKEVKLFLGLPNNFSPLPALIGMYEAYGTLLDRDYVINRTGSGTNTSYSAVPMDKVKFKNTKAKPYSEKKVIDILSKAFPVDDSKDTDDDYEEDYEDDDIEDTDDDEDNEYGDMSARELYEECIDRGLDVKKKKSKDYYIDILLEDDLENEDDDDDEDEDDDW